VVWGKTLYYQTLKVNYFLNIFTIGATTPRLGDLGNRNKTGLTMIGKKNTPLTLVVNRVWWTNHRLGNCPQLG
jgi:hypothetical protein